MRATNADVVAKEIEGYTEDVERRLRAMVAKFAYNATLAIQGNVPIGDQLSIDMGRSGATKESAAYYEFYKIRLDNPQLQIPEEAGYHRGALGYSESGNFQFIPIVFDADDAANQIRYDAESYYQVGDEFYIGARGPAYDFLDDNKSDQTNGQGIKGPSDDAIAAIYRTDMKRFYDSSN